MNDVLFARGQMAMSLAFHIVFASIGIAMPVCATAAEVLHRRTGDPEYLSLARRWAKGTAVLFAIGAVSGTVLSFELGLLFPRFMEFAGVAVGTPFSLEGFAFFAEAIFLGIYLYGWDRVRPGLHVFAGVVVAASGLASAAFVILVNAWMNAPRGFRLVDGELVDVDPVAAMANPFALHQIAHMAAAAYLSTGLAVAAIHAFALLRDRRNTFHRKALGIALAMAVPCALVQPLIGHWAGQVVAREQPMKLAASEGLVRTQAHAPLRLGPLELPGGLSIMAHGHPSAVVEGLEEIPRADWPHPIVRTAFLTMVALGSLLALHALWAVVRLLRRRPLADSAPFLWATLLAGPLGFLATEAGWVVTEVGRQPWVVYGILRTAETVTPVRGLAFRLLSFAGIYVVLALTVGVIVTRHVRATLRQSS